MGCSESPSVSNVANQLKLVRDFTPSFHLRAVYIGASVWHVPKLQTPRRKARILLHRIVCANSLGTVLHSSQLVVVGTPPSHPAPPPPPHGIQVLRHQLRVDLESWPFINSVGACCIYSSAQGPS